MMSTKELEAPAWRNANVQVWDTQYFPSSKAFSVFREAVASTFMPWGMEFKLDQSFDGRVEGMVFDKGSIGRVAVTPLTAHRTKRHIADSRLDCVYCNFVLSGEVKIEQAGRTNFAKPGDLVVYDSSLPVNLTMKADAHYEDLAFAIPKGSFSMIDDLEMHFQNVLLPRDQLLRPLGHCLNFIAENLHSSPVDELSALFDACVSLLPVAAGCYADKKQQSSVRKINHLLREHLDFISRNIANAELSPAHAAKHFDVSIRYVHKIFAGAGVTFGSYVMAKRLDHIRRELLSSSCGRHPISELAYRWGFNDLSTFNRAFKSRFGCTPSHFRMSSGCY